MLSLPRPSLPLTGTRGREAHSATARCADSASFNLRFVPASGPLCLPSLAGQQRQAVRTVTGRDADYAGLCLLQTLDRLLFRH